MMLSAIQLLQHKQEALQVGLHENNGTFYFHRFNEPKKYIRFNVLTRKSEDHWKIVHSSICNNSPACFQEGKDLLLWEITFIHNEKGENHEVILSSCHGIIDGYSRILFAQQLIECLEKVYEGRDDVERYEFPKSQEELCFNQTSELTNYRPFSSYFVPDLLQGFYFLLFNKKPDVIPLSKKAPKEEREDEFLYEHIEEKDMKKVLIYCKEQKISFHSLVTSIAILASKKTWNLKDGFKLGLSIPVGLRQYLVGKVDSNQMGSMNSYIDIQYPISDEPIEKVSGKAQEMIKKDLLIRISKNMFQFPAITSIAKLFSSQMLNDRKTEGRSNQVSISNIGKVKKPESKHFELTGLVAQGCNSYFGSNFSLSLVTFDSDCWITFAYTKPLISDEIAKIFVEEFRSILKNLY